MVLRVKPTPTQFLTNRLSTLMDNTPLHSIPAFVQLFNPSPLKALLFEGWRRAIVTLIAKPPEQPIQWNSNTPSFSNLLVSNDNPHIFYFFFKKAKYVRVMVATVYRIHFNKR